MKTTKILVLLIVGIFIISSTVGILGAGDNDAEPNFDDTTTETEKYTMALAKPVFKNQEEFVEVSIEEQTSNLISDGKPKLPVVTKVFNYPVGTVIKNVDVDIERKTYNLDKKVMPSPIAVPLASIDKNANSEDANPIDKDFYETSKLYPTEPYLVKTGAGLMDGEHSTILYIRCYTQYSSIDDEIYVPEKIEINIEYEEPTPSFASQDQYDLIIITHEKFAEDLQPLVDHKNNLIPPIRTKMVTVDEIYDQYDGVADWEEIKMYLADHVHDWGVEYVLLAGGHKGQTDEWYVPDFRSHNWNPEDAYDPPYDETYSADLYFADVYYVDQFGNHVMDDWDSNNNGIYGEGPELYPGGEGTKDDPDLIPDVCLGRLPFRYTWEVPIAVNKIIDYENNADDSWFKKAVLAGGDGFPPERYGGIADPDAWEGEIVCDEFAELLDNKDFESIKAYCSDEGDIQVKDDADVIDIVNQGCGFTHFTGHASPIVLGSYEPGTGITPPPLIPFYTGFSVRQFDNEGKLPFMICEGCHNAQFDVTTQNLIEGGEDFLFSRDEWMPHDSSSWFVLQKGGGAIGVIGNTALGLGGLNYGCTEFVGGWIMLRFAHAYAIQNKEFTGTVWQQGVTDYITNFEVSTDMGDRKTVEERALIGDPSIRLGGYKNSVSDSDDEQEEENIIPVSLEAPTWQTGDSWTYRVDNIDFNYDEEVEGREFDIKFSSGDITMEVTEVTADTYTTEIISDDIDVTLGLLFDFYTEESETLEIPTLSFENIGLNGQMILDKETLGIKDIQINIVADIMENIENLGIELPGFVDILKPYISIPANIDINVNFENDFPLIDFPLNTGNIWTLQENTVTVTIDGSVESVWLRVLNFLNRFIQIVPPEFAQYLPNVDIGDVLNDFGIDTEYTVEIPDNIPDNYAHAPIFEGRGEKTINVPGGTFQAAEISVLDKNAEIYFSESAKNVVKLSSPVSDYIPIFEDLNLELVSTNQ